MSASHVKLAKTLPPPLLRFFQRYPPQIYGKNTATSKSQITLNTSTSDPDIPVEVQSIATTSGATPILNNPFQRSLHPVTGRWHEPVYSLRRQADLVKLAKQHGVEDLLPTSVKGTEEQLAYRLEHGIRVRGTGIGQKVKGHWRERTLRARLDKRRQAMEDMPKLIYQWKQAGHGRGWKKFPK